MPLPDPKSKTITLRISDSDYRALKSLHRALGARNVSEVARSAIQRVLAQGAHAFTGDPVLSQILDLHSRVSHLESRLHHLTSRLGYSDEPLT